jgi:ABC-type molybdate transport system substrate-binding protein
MAASARNGCGLVLIGVDRLAIRPSTPYRLVLCLALLIASGQAASAWDSPAPDVVLYCLPALRVPLQTAAFQFTAASGIKVHLFLAPPNGLLGLIKHRARADVVAADAATIESLSRDTEIRAGSVTSLGQDPFVLISQAGAVAPAGAGLKQLVSTHPIVLPDPTTAASFDGAAVLRADPEAGSPSQEIGVSDTPTVVARVRAQQGLLGLVYQTESSEQGVAKAATLRVPPTEMSGALVTLGQSANAARFLAYIAGPSGQAIFRAAGLEPKS